MRFVLLLLAVVLLGATDAAGVGAGGAKALPSRWTSGVDKSKPVVQSKSAKKKDKKKEEKRGFFSGLADSFQSNLPSRWNLGTA
jgi:hypothetical protein